MMYYYKRKSNPFKWVAVVIIFMALGALVYWFYFNYFSRIELNNPQATNLNTPAGNPAILSGEISQMQGDVQVNINQNGYEKAIDQAVLHQGDQIKTGTSSLAVLKLGDNINLRLGENTEVMLSNLDDSNILIELDQGRLYNNVIAKGQYQIKALKTMITSLGTKFEVDADANAQTVMATVFENKAKVEIFDSGETILSSLLSANDKASIDLKAAKKDMLKLDTVDPKVLAKDAWYKWNFDQDQGLTANAPDQEPAFSEVTDSLVLKAEQKGQLVNLSWSIYNHDDFKSYQIVRSETKNDLKYPDDGSIKSSSDSSLAAYTDASVTAGKKYNYRICVVKNNDKVACGNLLNIEIAPADTVPPAAPALSASISVAGVSLSWTPNIEADFKEYRILKSITDPHPSFPTAGYLAKREQGNETYLDKDVNITYPFNVYYRVCSLDTALNFSCSNVITVEQGAIKQ